MAFLYKIVTTTKFDGKNPGVGFIVADNWKEAMAKAKAIWPLTYPRLTAVLESEEPVETPKQE